MSRRKAQEADEAGEAGRTGRARKPDEDDGASTTDEGLLPMPAVPPASSEATHHSMQANRSKDTKPELLVRRYLRENGLTGYRLQYKKASGRPDIAFVGRRVAIFVHGCFWHRCPYCNLGSPQTHRDFWDAKFERNQLRDRRDTQELVDMGWTVVVIWECRLRKKRARRTMQEVVARVRFAGWEDAPHGAQRQGRVVVIGRVQLRGSRGLAARRVRRRAQVRRGVHRGPGLRRRA